VALDDRYANKFAPLDSIAIYPKPDHPLIYMPMTSEMKCPRLYLCLAHSNPSPMLMQHMHQPITNDMIHFISSHDHIGSSILTSLAFHHCLSPSAPSPRLALRSCKQSVKPSLVSIFSSLVTWLYIISHMQWAPSSHVWALQHIQAISTFMAYVAHTYVPMD
jgi:hypothetical protein